MVGIGCLLILIANAILFRAAAVRTDPNTALKAITLISLVWMIAGAWGIGIRKQWGRAMTLTVLYAGSLGYFLTVLVILTEPQQGAVATSLVPYIIATAIYLFVSLVVTRSKHVRRLTSRAWE